MRTSILPLLCLLAACGPSEVEVTEAQRAKTQPDGARTSTGEAPVDLGDGLILTVLERGGGDFVRAGGRVRVHYTADVVAVQQPQVEDEPEADAEPEAETSEDAPTQDPETEGETSDAASEEPAADEVPVQGPDSDAETDAIEPSADAAPEVAAFPRRFDSSRVRGVPDDWDLARTARPRLIEGLRRGLVGQTAGSRVTLYVPAALAWGEDGLSAANVPPRADVLYEIELLEVLP